MAGTPRSIWIKNSVRASRYGPSMRPTRVAAVAGVFVVLAACDRTRQIPPGTPEAPIEVAAGDPTGGSGGGTVSVAVGDCTRCHGTPGLAMTNADPLVAAAPPRALSGEPADPAIGAHRAHLVNGTFRDAMECASCHLLPTPSAHPPQRQGRVSFSRLATTAWTGPAVAPAWNGTTCASTYCHGNFRNGQPDNAPTWTGGAAQGQCGSCHGVPPGGSHVQDAPGAPLDCGGCHPGYTRTSVNLALHVNGRVDGGGGHPAGWIEPDQHGLAALQENLTPCATCHVGFGPAAGAGTSCDGCHADPSLYGPYAGGPYPQHPSWKTECTFCHGGRDGASGAPPRNTHVVSSNTTTPQPTSDATIGAHTSHVGTAASAPTSLHGISTALDCTACHETRWTSALDPGHVDKTTADVLFNPVGATANGGSYARPSCSSTYCHGDFTGGAGAGAVGWTGAFGGALTLSCASCHAAPPATSATVPHPPNPGCGSCHTGYAAGTVNAATHVDGAVQHTPATGCTQCHGDLGASGVANTDVRAAPAGDANAVDAHGNAATSTTARGVGTHAKHLTGTTWRTAPIACAECHAVPAAGDTSHATGTAVLTFGTLARTAWSGEPAISPVWNGAGGATTLTCSSTYCHGAFKNGTNAAPTWTAAGSVGCGSCHGLPPAGNHPVLGTGQTCASCHGSGYAAGVDKTLHMNGVLDVAGGHPAGWKEPDQHGLAALAQNLTACTTCHVGFGPVSGAASSCDGCHADPSLYGPYATGTYPQHPSWRTECTFCHGGRDGASGAPPRNTHVISSDTTTPQPTSDATIGAHTSHVGTAASAPASLHGISAGLDCTACHATRWVSALDAGHVDKTTADVVFNPVGATTNRGSYARPSCASTYCHGDFRGGAGTAAVQWTGAFGGASTLSCASCHAAPPATSATVPHPPNPSCGSCHTGYAAGAVNAATHVDGAVQHTPATGCTQCHGDLGANGVANTDVRAAPAGDASAVDAHGNAATNTGARGVGTHAKHLTSTTWRAAPIACNECHAVPAAGDTAHATGTPTLSFGTLARTAWSGQPAITPVWNGAGGATTLTCSSTYCHGAFKNGANAAPTWTAAGSVACGGCHGVSATNGPGGTHPTFGTGQTCGSCHGGTYTNASVDPAFHMNGALDVANLTCSSCHGTATRIPVASATALDALGANLVLASPPLDAGHGATATGAHLAHVNQGDTAAPGALSNALACTACHAVPTSTGHSNGTVTVTFAGLSVTGGAVPAPYDFTGHGCSSTYCHGAFTGGNGANPIAWTATGKLACNGCHGAPPAPTSATLHHPPNPACASCHTGYTGTSVAVATHVDGAVQHVPATGCTQCHGDLGVSNVANTDVRAAPAGDASAVDAHGNVATTARGVGTHGKHLTATTWRATPIACNECHAVPAAGDVAHANGNPAVAFGTLARTAWAGQPAITPAWNGAGGGTTLTCSSTYCHGAFPNGANAAPTWTAAGSVACGSCHGVSASNGPGGSHPTLTAGQNCGTCHGGSYTNASVDLALHMNGQLDGGGEPTSGGTSCGSCHGTIFNAMNGSVAKATKHTLGSDVPLDGNYSWTGANLLASVTPANRSCVTMCHSDHPHGTTAHGTNVYADATTQTTRAGTRLATDFDAAQANGGLCTSCHQKPVDANTPVQHPAVAKAMFQGAAHDFTSKVVGAATYAWQYTLHDGSAFVRDCTKCHASSAEGTTPTVSAAGSATVAVHFGDDASLLAGKSRPGGTAAGFVCYNCHGSAATPAAGVQGNRSGKDIQTQILHATTAGQSGHPANSDNVHDSAVELANATFGNTLGVTGRHASCMDCHDTHEAKATSTSTRVVGSATNGNLAGPALHGAWGARLSSNPAFWTAPATGNFTKTTLVAGTDVEATLCFKCHSAYYGTLPAAPSWAPSTWAETDVAKEFNPANVGNFAGTWANGETAGSFHPVLASAGGNLGATGNIKAPWTQTSLMTCSDCHESDNTTDPNGPHGSAARFILKGANTTWNNTLCNSSTGMPNGTFCINCHNQNYSGGRFPAHTSRSNHYDNNGTCSVKCFHCHSAIPHGAPRPGLLNTVGRGTNVPGAYAGYDGVAPYYQAPNTTNGLYIVSYPTNNTTTWGQSNCGCGPGGGH